MQVTITWLNWNDYREVWKRGKNPSDNHTHVKYVLAKHAIESKEFTTTPLSTSAINKTITISDL